MCGDPRRQAQSQKPGALLTYEERMKKAEALTVNKASSFIIKADYKKMQTKGKEGHSSPSLSTCDGPTGPGDSILTLL